MKLTILALALSTYRCGATPRKLPAVAEAEEDYYYDGEVNTYYDDADADDTSVELRAPISGVDDVPVADDDQAQGRRALQARHAPQRVPERLVVPLPRY